MEQITNSVAAVTIAALLLIAYARGHGSALITQAGTDSLAFLPWLIALIAVIALKDSIPGGNMIFLAVVIGIVYMSSDKVLPIINQFLRAK